MGRNLASCVLCGAPIGDQDSTWLSEFRAIYTEDHEWMNPRLSGIGIRAPLADLVPTDAALRHNDPGLDPSSLMDVWLFKSTFGRESLAVPPADPENAWGFPFHDSCWGLLSALHSPKEVDIQLLNNLCRSCPQQWGQLNWGHNFGELVQYKTDPNDLLPGEECVLTAKLNIDHTAGDSFSNSMYSSDPLDLPYLQQVLNQSFDPEKTVDQVARKNLKTAFDLQDCFALIPIEILQEILLYLPSKDVLSLKLASAVFAETPLPETFWASRFQRGFEFHCVFEARRCPAKKCSWKTLYSGVRDLQSSLGFRNRRRVWEILLQLEELLSSLSSIPISGSLSRSFFEPNAPEDCLSWTFASGAIKEPKGFFQEGCRALWTRTVVLSKVIGVSVSFVEFSGVQYISGLRFRQHSGADICLGYNISKNELPMDMDFLLHDQEVCSISGFHLAIDPRGVRAVSLQTSKGQVSGWLGDPRGIPKMRLIARHTSHMALKGGFDALKLVSLGISDNNSINIDKGVPPTGTLFLRDTAQWFPNVPDEKLSLNEASFSELPRQPLKYRPLTMMLYGGMQGIHLSKLIEIVVWIVDFENIYGIDFMYNVEVDGQRVYTLGRRGPFLDTEPRSYEPCDSSTDQRICFQIDGPGGEIIDGVDIQETKHFEIRGFRIHTNRGRMATFPPNLEDDLAILPVHVDKSTTITGFYARLENPAILLNLGVISERV